jgi:hypothetical protein
MKRTTAERWAILGRACAECGAKPGTPCVAISTGRNHKKGDPMNGFHVKRVLNNSAESRTKEKS